MARNFVWSLGYFCLLLLTSACQEGGFFSPVTDVSPDRLPKRVASQLVIGSFISPQDTVVRVMVTETTPLYDTLKQNPAVINARVVLSNATNDSLVLSFDKRGYYQQPVGTFRLTGGETYRLTVSTPDGRRVMAICTIPNQTVSIQGIRVDSGLVRTVDVGSTSIDSTIERYAFIRWRDIAGPTYYRVYGLLEQTEEVLVDNKLKTVSFSKLLYFSDEGKRSMIISDENQNGQVIQSANGIYWRGPYVGSRLVSQKITMYLLNTDKMYYDYYRSISAYQDAAQNPFAEPVSIGNNIQGGVGCFAGYNGSQASMMLQKL